MPTITATYESRRDADLAVEHLVQELEIGREDVSVGPEGDENTVGTEVDGADLDDDDSDEAALAGSVAVTVTVEDEERAEEVQELLEEFGCDDVRVDG